MPPERDDPIRYEVLLTEPAEAEVEAAYLNQMRYGERAAERWYAGFARALETLSLFPKGFALVSSPDALDGDVRQMLYGKGNSAYRILYRVFEPEAEEELGIVRIQHVRHTRQHLGAPARNGDHDEHGGRSGL